MRYICIMNAGGNLNCWTKMVYAKINSLADYTSKKVNRVPPYIFIALQTIEPAWICLLPITPRDISLNICFGIRKSKLTVVARACGILLALFPHRIKLQPTKPSKGHWRLTANPLTTASSIGTSHEVYRPVSWCVYKKFDVRHGNPHLRVFVYSDQRAARFRIEPDIAHFSMSPITYIFRTVRPDVTAITSSIAPGQIRVGCTKSIGRVVTVKSYRPILSCKLLKPLIWLILVSRRMWRCSSLVDFCPT